MTLKHMLIRKMAGMMGKAITFVFALFCVGTGMLSDVSAQTVTGTVRNRADFTPIRNIQIIMKDVMCPVYGMNFSCTIGRALDTATTGINGAFTIVLGEYLEFNDIDSAKNGAFQSRILMQSSSLTGTSSVIYMVPKYTSYLVKGRVFSAQDNQPVKGIRAVLNSSTLVKRPYPSYDTYDVIIPIDTAFSDANGFYSFSLDTEITKALITVMDLDNSENGGKFFALRSASFSPINDTATTIISMFKDDTPVSRPPTEHVSITAPIIRTVDGVVIVALQNLRVSPQSRILVLDARGVTVTRLQPSADGIVKWDSRNAARGIYFLRLAGFGSQLIARIVVP